MPYGSRELGKCCAILLISSSASNECLLQQGNVPSSIGRDHFGAKEQNTRRIEGPHYQDDNGLQGAIDDVVLRGPGNIPGEEMFGQLKKKSATSAPRQGMTKSNGSVRDDFVDGREGKGQDQIGEEVAYNELEEETQSARPWRRPSPI